MTLTVPVAREPAAEAGAGIISTDIPARLDRLRWGRFHTLVVVALGITWILDGLEVTLAGAVSPALQLRFSNADVGLVSSGYLAGERPTPGTHAAAIRRQRCSSGATV